MIDLDELIPNLKTAFKKFAPFRSYNTFVSQSYRIMRIYKTPLINELWMHVSVGISEIATSNFINSCIIVHYFVAYLKKSNILNLIFTHVTLNICIFYQIQSKKKFHYIRNWTFSMNHLAHFGYEMNKDYHFCQIMLNLFVVLRDF